MALVQVGFRTVVTLVDIEGDKTTRSYEMAASLYADAVTDAAALITALNAMTDDTIAGYTIETVFSDDAFALPLVANTQNFNQALLIYQLDGLPIHQGTQSIPAPTQGIFVASSGPNAKVVDVADAAVVAWRTLFQSGGGFYLSDGETADILLSGHRRSVRSTSGN